MFLYKQVPAERLSGLSGLNRFSLMGKPLLGLILINRIRASHGSCNHQDGLSPRKRKSDESVTIGINKSVQVSDITSPLKNRHVLGKQCRLCHRSEWGWKL